MIVEAKRCGTALEGVHPKKIAPNIAVCRIVIIKIQYSHIFLKFFGGYREHIKHFDDSHLKKVA